MTLAKTLSALIVGFACVAGAASDARADSLTWIIKSENPYRLQIKFYSQSRSVSWPGAGKAWGIADYKEHRYVLDCNRGEKICYGAWNEAGHWGVGLDSEHSCTKCCGFCNGGTMRITLY